MERIQDDRNGRMNSLHDTSEGDCVDTGLEGGEVQPDEHGLDAGKGEEYQAVLTLEDIRLATDNFSDKFRLDRTWDGKTYTGLLHKYPFVIAVKVYEKSAISRYGFQNEIRILRLCKHPNIVRLLGTTSWKTKNVIILEATPTGTLHSLLYADPERKISWDLRLDIALDVATGLAYLHDSFGKHIRLVHRGLNPSGIFLHGLAAKIADFQLSKLLTNDEEGADSFDLVGTIGYIAPELVESGAVSTAGDVYSFGVIILELITRTDPWSPSSNTRKIIERESPLTVEELPNIGGIPTSDFTPIYDLRHVLDSSLLPDLDYNRESISRLFDIGLRCIEKYPGARPTMKEVVSTIKTIITNRQSETNSLYRAPEQLGEPATNLGRRPDYGRQRNTDMDLVHFPVLVRPDDPESGLLACIRLQKKKLLSFFRRSRLQEERLNDGGRQEYLAALIRRERNISLDTLT